MRRRDDEFAKTMTDAAAAATVSVDGRASIAPPDG